MLKLLAFILVLGSSIEGLAADSRPSSVLRRLKRQRSYKQPDLGRDALASYRQRPGDQRAGNQTSDAEFEFEVCPDTHPYEFDNGKQCCSEGVKRSSTSCSGDAIPCSDEACESWDFPCDGPLGFIAEEELDFSLDFVHSGYLLSNKAVFRDDGNETCVWWQRVGRRWWLGDCENIGTDDGYAFFEDEVACPTRALTLKVLKTNKAVRIFFSAPAAEFSPTKELDAVGAINAIKQGRRYKQKCVPRYVKGSGWKCTAKPKLSKP